MSEAVGDLGALPRGPAWPADAQNMGTAEEICQGETPSGGPRF